LPALAAVVSLRQRQVVLWYVEQHGLTLKRGQARESRIFCDLRTRHDVVGLPVARRHRLARADVDRLAAHRLKRRVQRCSIAQRGPLRLLARDCLRNLLAQALRQALRLTLELVQRALALLDEIVIFASSRLSVRRHDPGSAALADLLRGRTVKRLMYLLVELGDFLLQRGDLLARADRCDGLAACPRLVFLEPLQLLFRVLQRGLRRLDHLRRLGVAGRFGGKLVGRLEILFG
jgi:hypothetical protein